MSRPPTPTYLESLSTWPLLPPRSWRCWRTPSATWAWRTATGWRPPTSQRRQRRATSSSSSRWDWRVRTFVDLFTSSVHESRSAKFRICISESERQLLLGLFHVGLKWNNVHFLSDFTNLNEYFTFFTLQSCSSGKVPAEAPVGKVRCTSLVTDYQCKSWTKRINDFQVKEERVFRTIEPVEGCGEGCAMPE